MTARRFCASCGAEARTEAAFCASCGAALGPLVDPTSPGGSGTGSGRLWTLGISTALVLALASVGVLVWQRASEPSDDSVSSDVATTPAVAPTTSDVMAPVTVATATTTEGTSREGTTPATRPTTTLPVETEPADGRTPECETALDSSDAVASLSELDFRGIEINVGSKDFNEQFVLGQLAIVGLEAGGATVKDSTDLGGTIVNRDALLANEIDTYFEYNGTGSTVHLANTDPSFDQFELTDNVCVSDLERNGIRWVGVSPFNNTYGFATAGDSPAAGLDLQGMMEYVNDNPSATVCMETEFPNRPDGLVLLEEATGLTIPAGQEQILDTAVIYDETASGTCTFGEVFTTDGRVPALGLELVDDPGLMIVYNVSMTMPDTVYQQAPEAFEALADTIFAGLDDDSMAELNRQVSVEGRDPRTVAENYLARRGLL